MRRAGLLELARAWIGTPYVHRAAVRGAGADCLGLVRGIWREAGGDEPEALPAYTADWSEAGGEERLWAAARRHLVPREGVAPGAVLLFRMRRGAVAKHLGIAGRTAADGPPSLIHAYSGHGVLESPLTAALARQMVAAFDFPWIED